MAYLTRIFFVYFALLAILAALCAGAIPYSFVNTIGQPLDNSTSVMMVITAAYLAAFPATLLHVIAESIAEFLD